MELVSTTYSVRVNLKPSNHAQKRELCDVTGVNLIVGISSQCSSVSDHHAAHLKHTVYLSITPQESWKIKGGSGAEERGEQFEKGLVMEKFSVLTVATIHETHR